MDRLSQSLEDYLETLYILSESNKVARVKEVSELLKVSTPSVVNALKSLARYGLVNHEHYGYIELTPQGKELACQIYEKHRIISNFFQTVLGVEKEVADSDACALEHSIHQETLDKIIRFFEFLETCSGTEPEFLKNLQLFLSTGSRPSCRREMNRHGHAHAEIPVRKLSELKVGEKSKVVKITAEKKIRRHLLALGVIRGEEIEMVRKAPLGDPIDFKIKDYHLSLRRSEADLIMVEK